MKKPYDYFKEILTIPRASGNEDMIATYLCNFAKKNSLEYVRDNENNVIIKKSGKGKGLILQGHSDMVCEKNESVEHDFDRDPIKVIIDGNELSAVGTTLGADDAISMCVMMCLLTDDRVTIPLECLITSQEEIGLLGMKEVNFTQLTGRRMINLDSMDEGVATVSCCGGVRSDIKLSGKRIKAQNTPYILKIRGLYGGHSGEDINKNRRNAILTAFEVLRDIENVQIVSIFGGSKDNAIPRECTVEFTSSDDDVAAKIENATQNARASLCEEDRYFTVSLENSFAEYSYDEVMTDRIYSFIDGISLGIIEMDHNIEGQVKTSANLGVISTDSDTITLTVSSRSSDESSLDALQAQIDSSAEANCGKTTHSGRYPGWDFEKDSLLRDLYLSTYEKLYKKKARYEGIHAGLECGIVKAAVPDMDIISIGANIRAPHTPDETLQLDSLDRLLETVLEIIKQIQES